MKTFLKVIGVLVLLFVVAVGAVFYFTSGMVTAVDEFFAAVAAQDMTKAHKYLAQAFRAATPEDELKAYLDRSALLDYSEAHWSNRQVAIGGTGQLDGEIVTKSKGVIPVSLAMIKEDGQWKIYSLRKQNAGLVTESGGQSIPSKSDAARLAVATTLDFGNAVKAKNLEPFYRKTTSEFQQQISLDDLNKQFGVFIEREIDLTGVANVTPVLTVDPGMTPEGVLQIAGYFPGQRARLEFSYKYVYRFTDWKLIGIRLQTVSNETRI